MPVRCRMLPAHGTMSSSCEEFQIRSSDSTTDSLEFAIRFSDSEESLSLSRGSSDEINEFCIREDDFDSPLVQPVTQPMLGSKKKGRIPFETKFPEVLTIIRHVLERNGAQAQRRRRSDEITSFGTHLPSLIAHLFAEVPGLRYDESTGTVI